uniref:Uncharacterized protein n=1 Tax=Anguilla anguilla TaxID=7936 RepID=A0A0E9SCZ7_ANGAN
MGAGASGWEGLRTSLRFSLAAVRLQKRQLGLLAYSWRGFSSIPHAPRRPVDERSFSNWSLSFLVFRAQN